jgi:hypothetical protein
MEFNKITTATTSTSEVVADKIISTLSEKITLTSAQRATVVAINDGIKITTSVLDYNTILVTHDTRDLIAKYNKESIKTALVSIYGKNNRLAISSKSLESTPVSLSEFPVKLEYLFTVTENNIPLEYTAEYLIPNKESSTIIPITGKKLSSVSEVTIPEAVVKIDDELGNIKTILQNFSYIYDTTDKKVVPLHQYITNLTIKLDNLIKNVDDIKEKVKNL